MYEKQRRCWTRIRRPEAISADRQRLGRKVVHNMAGYASQTALAESSTRAPRPGMGPGGAVEAVRQGAQGAPHGPYDGMTRQFLVDQVTPPTSRRRTHRDV